MIQQALDVVRVCGNNAVHPATMDVADSPAVVNSLFKLVNLIAEKTLTDKRHVDELFGMLPPESHAAIANRDRKTK
jgi:hypothetical protein